eukprot:3376994-Amphidinium_carterae.1
MVGSYSTLLAHDGSMHLTRWLFTAHACSATELGTCNQLAQKAFDRDKHGAAAQTSGVCLCITFSLRLRTLLNPALLRHHSLFGILLLQFNEGNESRSGYTALLLRLCFTNRCNNRSNLTFVR